MGHNARMAQTEPQTERRERVFVTGATGFVGRAVTAELLRRGYEVIAASRGGQGLSWEGLGSAAGVRCDVTDPRSVEWALRDTQPGAAVHLVGIITQKGRQSFKRVHVDGTLNLLKALRALKADADPDDPEARPLRYLHMSALGADPVSASRYSASKGDAERLVRASGLAWTIFRPSLIFGPGDDFFGRVLRDLVSQAPVVPQIGDGSFPFRPVSVQDVALAFAGALELPETAGKIYGLTGPQEFTFRELLLEELRALGKQKRIVPVPLALMDRLVPLMGVLPNPPITTDQYAMLKAGNTFPPEPARSVFGLPMLRLTEELPRLLRGEGATLRA